MSRRITSFIISLFYYFYTVPNCYAVFFLFFAHKHLFMFTYVFHQYFLYLLEVEICPFCILFIAFISQYISRPISSSSCSSSSSSSFFFFVVLYLYFFLSFSYLCPWAFWNLVHQHFYLSIFLSYLFTNTIYINYLSFIIFICLSLRLRNSNWIGWRHHLNYVKRFQRMFLTQL